MFVHIKNNLRNVLLILHSFFEYAYLSLLSLIFLSFSLRYKVEDTTRLISGKNYTMEIVGTDDVGNTDANPIKWSWLTGMLNYVFQVFL